MKRYFLILLMIPLHTPPTLCEAPTPRARYAMAYTGSALLAGVSLAKLITLLKRKSRPGTPVQISKGRNPNRVKRRTFYLVASVCGISAAAILGIGAGCHQYTRRKKLERTRPPVTHGARHDQVSAPISALHDATPPHPEKDGQGQAIADSVDPCIRKLSFSTPDSRSTDREGVSSTDNTPNASPIHLLIPTTPPLQVRTHPGPGGSASFLSSGTPHSCAGATPFSEDSNAFTPVLNASLYDDQPYNDTSAVQFTLASPGGLESTLAAIRNSVAPLPSQPSILAQSENAGNLQITSTPTLLTTSPDVIASTTSYGDSQDESGLDMSKCMVYF